jgi:MFS family permease
MKQALGLGEAQAGDLAAGLLVTGLASGGANVPVMGLVAAWFPARRRGLATGIAESSGSSATAFLIAGAAAFAGALGSLALRGRRSD